MLSYILKFTDISSDLRIRFRNGVSWNIISAIFIQGSTVIVNIIVANILGKNIFGEFSIIQNTLLTLTGISQVAIGITVTKYVAEYRSINKKRTGIILGLCSIVTLITGSVGSLLLILNAHWLANNILKAPQLSNGLYISGVFVFFSVINGYQTGALAGLESYLSIARGNIIQGIVYLGICIFTTKLWGLEGALLGLVIGALVRWFIFFKLLQLETSRQDIYRTYQGIWLELPIILKFAFPAAISGLISISVLWLANTLLVRQENGFSQMGLYSAANNLRALVLFLPLMLNNVGTSLLNNKKGLGDDKQFYKLFWLNITITAIFVLLGGCFVALAGKNILTIYGKDFVEGHYILLILLISTIPEGLAVATYQIIQSNARMWLSLFTVTIPRDLSFLLLAYFLIPKYGGDGLAVSYSIAWTLACSIIIIIVSFFKGNLSSV